MTAPRLRRFTLTDTDSYQAWHAEYNDHGPFCWASEADALIERLLTENRGMLQQGGYEYLSDRVADADRKQRAARWAAEEIAKERDSAAATRDALLDVVNEHLQNLGLLAEWDYGTERLTDPDEIRYRLARADGKP